MRQRSRRRRAALAAAVCLILGASPASAQTWFGQMGAEADDADGYVFSGALGGSFSESTSWDLSALRSATTANLVDLSRNALGASIYHDFGPVGLRVGLGGWNDDGLLQADSATGSLDFQGERWTFAIRTELRFSDFDPVQIDRTIVRRDGSPLTIAARADCSVDDTGLGARLSFSSAEWYFDVGAMAYDYDDFACDFDVAALDVLRNATRDEFVQLADRATDLLSLGAGRRLLAETSLLDSHVGATLSNTRGLRTYRISYDRVEDIFFGRTATTLTGGLAFLLESGNEVEVYTGFTDSDAYENVVFLGVSVFILR